MEKAMAPYSNTLAWKIPWTEEPGRLQSMGSWRVGHDWATSPFTFHFHTLEKEMTAHSSILAWRIPRTEEPGRLPSMGSHRVRPDWSDLAVAAVLDWMNSPFNTITNILTFSPASLEQFLRVVSDVVSRAPVLVLPQIKLNSQLSCCAFFQVDILVHTSCSLNQHFSLFNG